MLMNHRRRAFSFVELLITLVIISFVGLGIFSAFRYYNVTAQSATLRAQLNHELRKAADVLKYTLLEARQVYDNSFPYATTPALTGATGSSELIVEIPSVNASGNFINFEDLTYIDYVRFYLTSGVLTRMVYRGTTAPGSARSATSYDVAENISSVSFRYNGVLLGDMTAAELFGLNSVDVHLTAERQNIWSGEMIQQSLEVKINFRNDV